jgi:hypothetical protein
MRDAEFDPEQPRDDSGKWTTGADTGIPAATSIDALSLADNKALLATMVERYNRDPNMRGAATVVARYAELSQETGLATRAIVERALKGKTPEQILADPKVQKLLADVNNGRRPEYAVGEAYVREIAAGAPGYYATLRDIEPTTEVVYRGIGGVGPKADEFELRGPTAFSHSKDAAMTYAGRALIEVVPGAKMLPTKMLAAVKGQAEKNDPHATLPVMEKRSENAVHPLGPSYGFSIDMDTDRELTSSGRFRVVGRENRVISFRSEKTGKMQIRTVNVIKVKHVGVF